MLLETDGTIAVNGAIRLLDLGDASLAREVLAMQQSAYTREAEMIGFWEIPPLVESLEELRASREQFWGYFVGETLGGAVACERAGDMAEVSRMMVRPDFTRRGIARALLAHVAMTHRDARWLRVSTGSLNEPAVRLYEGFGFVEQRRREVAPGVWVTEFEMPMPGMPGA